MAQNRMSAVYEYFTETEKEFTCKIAKEGRLCGMEIAQMKSGGGLFRKSQTPSQTSSLNRIWRCGREGLIDET